MDELKSAFFIMALGAGAYITSMFSMFLYVTAPMAVLNLLVFYWSRRRPPWLDLIQICLFVVIFHNLAGLCAGAVGGILTLLLASFSITSLPLNFVLIGIAISAGLVSLYLVHRKFLPALAARAE